MDSNPFKRNNIIIDYKNKKAISPQPNLNKIPKNKIKDIKYLDSNELTKDETYNKFDKIIDKKNENINSNNIIILKDKNYIKKIKLNNYISNRDSIRNLNNLNSNKHSKINNNFKYFNKNDIYYLLNNRCKTLEESLRKKNKIKFNILNEVQCKPKEHYTKTKSYDLKTFNENDLINKLKNIKFKKYNNNTYKDTIKEELYIDDNQKQHGRLKKKKNISNILIDKRFENTKRILYPLQSKMKTYTNISEIIRGNIINNNNNDKEEKSKQKYIKEEKNKIKKIKNKLMNKNGDNFILNTEHLIEHNSNLEEKTDFQDIPQRRPGCSGEKNMTTIINETNYITNKKIFKKKEFKRLHPNTTFTKSIKTSTLVNNNNIEPQGNSNINSKSIKAMIKKFQTQRFSVNLHRNSNNNTNNNKKEKKKRKINKNKNSMYYININKNIPKSNNKLVKYLNFNLFDPDNKNESKVFFALKSNSFSSDFNRINNYQSKTTKKIF